MLKTPLLLIALAAPSLFAQQSAAPAPAAATTPPAAPHAGTALRKHLYVMDNVSHVDKSSVTNYGFGITTGSAATETVHGAPIIMGEIQKRCPSVTPTVNIKLAEYVLIPQSGSSQLLHAGDGDRAGDIVYISPALKVKNLVKDVCKYIEAH